jgi:hypothetical protein
MLFLGMQFVVQLLLGCLVQLVMLGVVHAALLQVLRLRVLVFMADRVEPLRRSVHLRKPVALSGLLLRDSHALVLVQVRYLVNLAFGCGFSLLLLVPLTFLLLLPLRSYLIGGVVQNVLQVLNLLIKHDAVPIGGWEPDVVKQNELLFGRSG